MSEDTYRIELVQRLAHYDVAHIFKPNVDRSELPELVLRYLEQEKKFEEENENVILEVRIFRERKVIL